jgi:ketosteroid isomerase-like protein
MSQENVELVRRTFAFLDSLGPHLGRDEIAAELTDAQLSEFFDPATEWVPVRQGILGGRRYEGYEGIRQFWTDFFSAWDEFRAEPQELVASGDQVAVVIRMSGRMHDLQVDEVWSSLLTLRNGRIVRIQGFSSESGAREAAGLTK